MTQASEQLCRVSKCRSNEAAPNRVGSRQAGRLVALIMPEARVQSLSGNAARLHKNDIDTLSSPPGGSTTECCGHHTVETGAVGAMCAR